MYRQIIKALIPFNILEWLKIVLNYHAEKSYSQEGEDMILRRIFEQKKKGFYVDVGAHHPVRFSNTYFFYRRGWSGINIDAMPGSMRLFNKYRQRDINIETPVGDENRPMTYYRFNEPALNGFDPRLSISRDDPSGNYQIIDTIQLVPRKLKAILDEYLPNGQHIDFLSVDVEGFDFEVLKSNNWEKYRPDMVLLEILDSTLLNISGSALNNFLTANGYEIYAKSVNTVIYRLKILA